MTPKVKGETSIADNKFYSLINLLLEYVQSITTHISKVQA